MCCATQSLLLQRLRLSRTVLNSMVSKSIKAQWSSQSRDHSFSFWKSPFRRSDFIAMDSDFACLPPGTPMSHGTVTTNASSGTAGGEESVPSRSRLDHRGSATEGGGGGCGTVDTWSLSLPSIIKADHCAQFTPLAPLDKTDPDRRFVPRLSVSSDSDCHPYHRRLHILSTPDQEATSIQADSRSLSLDDARLETSLESGDLLHHHSYRPVLNLNAAPTESEQDLLVPPGTGTTLALPSPAMTCIPKEIVIRTSSNDGVQAVKPTPRLPQPPDYYHHYRRRTTGTTNHTAAAATTTTCAFPLANSHDPSSRSSSSDATFADIVCRHQREQPPHNDDDNDTTPSNMMVIVDHVPPFVMKQRHEQRRNLYLVPDYRSV
jgi:hypothetical protein